MSACGPPLSHGLRASCSHAHCSLFSIVITAVCRTCTCPGCAALAIQAVRMAHIQATRLFSRVEKYRSTQPARWRSVGHSLARILYVHVCLLLETEAQTSPTRASVWRAEQCLKEWDRLSKSDLTEDCGVQDMSKVGTVMWFPGSPMWCAKLIDTSMNES